MSLPKQGYFSKINFNKTVNISFSNRPQTERTLEGRLKLSVINKLQDAHKTTALKLSEAQY